MTSLTIRDATDDDWPQIFPIFTAIVGEGRTYAYPENLSSAQAHDLWMLDAPGRTVVAQPWRRFRHAEHGYVGLHVMFRPLTSTP